MNLFGFGKEKLPSIIKDPFNKLSITQISIRYRDFCGDGKWKATGEVDFKNGNTSGEQSFEGETFDEVVMQIKVFIESLEQH